MKTSNSKTMALALAAVLLAPLPIQAAVQQHTFSITGTNGVTGTGSFTWDDTVIPNGTFIEGVADLLTVDINLTGGPVVGGSTHFSLADCTFAYLETTPDFSLDINFWCDNGTNDLVGIAPYTNSLNDGQSLLTFTPGTTSPVEAKSIPTISEWSMIMLTTLIGIGAFFGLRHQTQGRRRTDQFA